MVVGTHPCSVWCVWLRGVVRPNVIFLESPGVWGLERKRLCSQFSLTVDERYWFFFVKKNFSLFAESRLPVSYEKKKNRRSKRSWEFQSQLAHSSSILGMSMRVLMDASIYETAKGF